MNSLWILVRIWKWSLLPLSSLSNELKICLFRFFYHIHLVPSSVRVSITFNINDVIYQKSLKLNWIFNQSECSIVCVFNYKKLLLFCTLQNYVISFTANFNSIYNAFGWQKVFLVLIMFDPISTVNLNSLLRIHRASGGFVNQIQLQRRKRNTAYSTLWNMLRWIITFSENTFIQFTIPYKWCKYSKTPR